ncbi:response regulator transcription factor [Streptomyces lavendulocolor]|uniref:response regulator transcription factor n=1 Tax=Streptomyces lavendulocolor TaxID=67316 RepID=UPI0031D09957
MINVVIAHDQALLQAGLRNVLGDEVNIRVVGTCQRSDVAETVERHRPKVVVLGDHASRARTLSSIDVLHSIRTPPKVVLLASRLDDSLTADALMKGASGVLEQDSTPELLVSAIRVAATGGQVLANPASRTVVSLLNQGGIEPAIRERAGTLTPREIEVCALLAEGLSNTEIALRLHLSVATVKDHTRAIYMKLGTPNRVRAAILMYQLGMFAPANATLAS